MSFVIMTVLIKEKGKITQQTLKILAQVHVESYSKQQLGIS